MNTATKTALRWIAWITGTLLVVLTAVFLVWIRPVISGMKPAPTGSIDARMVAVCDSYVNMYLFDTGSGYIAFDAGISKKNVAGQLKTLSIDPASVKAVFFTHCDSDHVGGLELFGNASIYLSAAEKQMIDGTTARFPLQHNAITRSDYSLLADGQTVTIDSASVYCIATPGHTRGAMCYLVNGKYLVTGDALNLQNGKAVPFFNFINMDSRTATQSMQKLKGFAQAKYLLTAHTGYTADYAAAW